MEKKKIAVSQTSKGFTVELITMDVKTGKFAGDETAEFVGSEELDTKPTSPEAFEFARAESKRLGVELKSLE